MVGEMGARFWRERLRQLFDLLDTTAAAAIRRCTVNKYSAGRAECDAFCRSFHGPCLASVHACFRDLPLGDGKASKDVKA